MEKGHGRIETRRIAVRPIPSRLDREWPAARQVVRLERLRELKDRCQRQIVYAITSLPPEAIDAEGLLELARAHWQVENRLFHVRDRTFAEDACRVRTGSAPPLSPICATPASPSSERKSSNQNPPERHSPQTTRPLSAPSSNHELNGPVTAPALHIAKTRRDIQKMLFGIFGKDIPVALYIRDSSVDDLAEQVRARLGARNKTEAVRTALRNELARAAAATPLRKRLDAVRERARRELGPPVPGIDMKKLMDELWEEGA